MLDNIVTNRNFTNNSTAHKCNARFCKIDPPLPFFYFIYTSGDPLHLMINNTIVAMQKYSGVFIKTFTPFSFLFERNVSDFFRPDIYVVQFTSEDISKHNVLFDHDFIRLKNISSDQLELATPDFVQIDFSGDEEECNAMTLLISQCAHCYTSKHMSPINIIHSKIRTSYLLSCISQKNEDIYILLHAPFFYSISEMVAKIIMTDYSRKWNISELARLTLMSESTLKRKMHREVGAINSFIHKIKLTEGLRKLRRTNTPISVISSDLGYSSPSHFSKVFFKYFNIYPRDIRKRHKLSC